MLVTKFLKKLSGNKDFENKHHYIRSDFSMKKKKIEWNGSEEV